MAQRKHFPSVNWLTSYSKYRDALEPYYNNFDPEFVELRSTAENILRLEDELTPKVQKKGKDKLEEDEKVTLEMARIIRENFLQQNSK